MNPLFGVTERSSGFFFFNLPVFAFENIHTVKVSKAHASCVQKIKSVVKYNLYVNFVQWGRILSLSLSHNHLFEMWFTELFL